MGNSSNDESPQQKKPRRNKRIAKKNHMDDWQSNVSSLEEQYKFMFNNELYADVHFIVGQEQREKVSANKIVLCAGSVVFDTMFSKKWSSDQKEIEIPDLEPSAFKELLRFIYCRETCLTKDIVWSVLYAAKKYCVNALRCHCVDFIKYEVLCYNNACFNLMKQFNALPECIKKLLRNGDPQAFFNQLKKYLLENAFYKFDEFLVASTNKNKSSF